MRNMPRYGVCGRDDVALSVRAVSAGHPYNRPMDEQEYRKRADSALEGLKASLIRAEADAEMEVEEQGGAIHISFEEPPGRFVISPNSAARQIWISALSTSFKLDWSEEKADWVLARTGEALKPLVARLIGEQTGEEVKLA